MVMVGGGLSIDDVEEEHKFIIFCEGAGSGKFNTSCCRIVTCFAGSDLPP